MDFAEVVRMLAALALTLGLIGVLAWAARRFGPTALLRLTPPSQRRIQVLESLVLDPSRRLVLVKVDEQERLLLLGEGQCLSETRTPRRRKSPDAQPA